MFIGVGKGVGDVDDDERFTYDALERAENNKPPTRWQLYREPSFLLQLDDVTMHYLRLYAMMGAHC